MIAFPHAYALVVAAQKLVAGYIFTVFLLLQLMTAPTLGVPHAGVIHLNLDFFQTIYNAEVKTLSEWLKTEFHGEAPEFLAHVGVIVGWEFIYGTVAYACYWMGKFAALAAYAVVKRLCK